MGFLWFKTEEEKFRAAQSKADKQALIAKKISQEADREKRRIAHEQGLRKMNENKKKRWAF